MLKKEHARHVVAACQSYLTSDVHTSLESLRKIYAAHIDPHVFEEASVAIELLYAKLAQVSLVISEIEYHHAAASV